MSEYIDSNGNEVGWLSYLVKKSSFLDGTYRFKPEEAYCIEDWTEIDAYLRYGENPKIETIKNLIFRDDYVAVEHGDFDNNSLVRAIKQKEAREQEARKKIYEEQRRSYEERKNRKGWWARLFS